MRIRHALGLDQPLHVQYFRFLTGLIQGDLGNSLSYKTSAMGVVIERFPATIELTLAAFFIAIAFAVPLGVLAALYRGTAIDGGIMTLAMFGQSIPSFWLGIMMILVLGLGLSWFPISGHVEVLAPMLRGEFMLALTNLPKAIPYLVMPGVAPQGVDDMVVVDDMDAMSVAASASPGVASAWTVLPSIRAPVPPTKP